MESLKNRIRQLEKQLDRQPEASESSVIDQGDPHRSNMPHVAEEEQSPVASAEIRLRSSAGAIKVGFFRFQYQQMIDSSKVHKQLCCALWTIVGVHASSR